ncbi:transcriptional regulator, LacI family [Lutibacter oricola]|uniref:Transcriptional regulator, LacI family n=1 Tax=Lutibacter oricola TaxID=762486 RepID=A0A1H2U9Q3_9FLAO|nr:LacI family DNA-binding transcriptional regulator [Lutibacter oricola]SDW52339.1 transcriptional regulator, LacI family [Lutibacter oricola]
MRKKVSTLKEIAQKLDLSTSTVSRALNDHPDISTTTKQKVQKLANKLHYTPNIFAQGFRKNKTNIIGVIVPNVTHYFSSTLIKGILKEADIKGYKVIITESNNDIKKQSEMLQTMAQFGVDGILMSVSKKTKSFTDILDIMNRIPLVLFDKVSYKIPCTQIVVNEAEASYKAIEHLIQTGKKRIAIIKENKFSYNSERRYEGYLKALKQNNIEIDNKIIVSCEDLNLEQGRRMTKLLLSLKHKPDAIFTITDSAAIGVIKTLKRFKIKIPREIAVVGFSNSLYSTIIEPKLTTIDQPGEKIGKTAVTYLINEIENPEERTTSKTVEIATNLIVRDSSLKISY